MLLGVVVVATMCLAPSLCLTIAIGFVFTLLIVNRSIEGVALLRRPCYLCGRKRNSFRNITKRQKKAHTVM